MCIHSICSDEGTTTWPVVLRCACAQESGQHPSGVKPGRTATSGTALPTFRPALTRSKGLHTRDQHLRNHRGFSVAFSN